MSERRAKDLRRHQREAEEAEAEAAAAAEGYPRTSQVVITLEEVAPGQTNIRVQGPLEPVKCVGVLELAKAKVLEMAFAARQKSRSPIVGAGAQVLSRLKGRA